MLAQTSASAQGAMLPKNATVGDLSRLMKRPKFAVFKDRFCSVVERRRGKSLRAIARAIGRSVSFVKTWNDRFMCLGAEALVAHPRPTCRSRLNEEQRCALKARILAGPTSDDQVAVFTI